MQLQQHRWFQTAVSQTCLYLLIIHRYCGYQNGMKKDQQGSGTNTMPSLVHMPENTNKVEKTMLQNPHQLACQHNLALVINERIVYQMSHCDLHISHSKVRLCRRDKAYHAYLFLSFHRVLNVICSFLGNSPASEF